MLVSPPSPSRLDGPEQFSAAILTIAVDALTQSDTDSVSQTESLRAIPDRKSSELDAYLAWLLEDCQGQSAFQAGTSSSNFTQLSEPRTLTTRSLVPHCTSLKH